MNALKAPPMPAAVLRSVWRRLRTMRTAIVLLLVLALGASVGSFFPQRPVDVRAVDRWIETNGSLARVAEFFGLFDVYGSWWFMGIYGCLLVSLVGCLLPRYRAFWRVLRARPYTAASLAGQPHHHARVVAAGPATLLHRAEQLLRARRFRVARNDDVVAAERGNWREGGSLLFHTAFLVLLFGMTMGKLLGYSGQVAVIEGERFTDTPIEYDFLSEGRYFGSRFTGFEIELLDFEVSWYPNQVARSFVSQVRLTDGDVVREERIEVNSPMTHRGVRVHQVSWGWAPHVTVGRGSEVLYRGPTIFLQSGSVWHGVAKVPQARPEQLGVDMLLFTDPEIDPEGRPRNLSPEPRRPVIVYQEFLGDLGLTKPQSVYELDLRALAPGRVGAIGIGESADLANGIRVTFDGLGQYSVFQIARNPGALLLLVAAVAILVGLLPALYSSRRRVWVRATPTGDGTLLEIAGHALQRKTTFAEDFAAIVRELDRDEKVKVPSG